MVSLDQSEIFDMSSSALRVLIVDDVVKGEISEGLIAIGIESLKRGRK